jgi:hypothetical protein
MILRTKTIDARAHREWHSPRTAFVESLLPTKANRSRGRGAKPQVRSHRGLDSWAAEDRASLAPGEQALQAGEGRSDVHIAH